MSENEDPEVRAAGLVAAALEPLTPDARKRVCEWMRERYESGPMYDSINTLAITSWGEIREAARPVVERCPICSGSGELAADEHGFRPRCGMCGPLRLAIENQTGKKLGKK